MAITPVVDMNALLGVRIKKRVIKETGNIMEDRYVMDTWQIIILIIIIIKGVWER
jgi:hypothetical protein